jgi:hypothetical protein
MNSMSFGEVMISRDYSEKYAKKPLYKTPEGSGTQRDLAPKKEASRRIKDPPGRSGPRGGPTPARAAWWWGRLAPMVPNGPIFRKVLPSPMGINLNHSLGRFDQTTHV